MLMMGPDKCLAVQALTKWYRDMPERLGKMIAERSRKGAAPVPSSRRKALCDKRELEFLRGLGLSDEEAKKMMPTDYDPVVAGVRKGEEVH